MFTTNIYFTDLVSEVCSNSSSYASHSVYHADGHDSSDVYFLPTAWIRSKTVQFLLPCLDQRRQCNWAKIDTCNGLCAHLDVSWEQALEWDQWYQPRGEYSWQNVPWDESGTGRQHRMYPQRARRIWRLPGNVLASTGGAHMPKHSRHLRICITIYQMDWTRKINLQTFRLSANPP